jgi:DNA-binding GntR family transcriptional regulator
MPAQESVRQQLSQDVATYVRELIISGGIQKDEFIRIETVAKAMGISNTPVREGLLLLQNENFVRLVPRRGFMVSGFSKEDIQDIFLVQGILAGELAARAAKRMTKEEMERVSKIHAAHEQAVAAGDAAVFSRTGHQFHRAINLAARSPRLANLLGSMTKQLPNRFYAAIEGQVQDTLDYHPRILQAIRARNAKKARQLMHDHLVSAADHLIKILEQQGMWANEEARDPEGRPFPETAVSQPAPQKASRARRK